MADAFNTVTKELIQSVDATLVRSDHILFIKSRDNSDYQALVQAGVPMRYWKVVADRLVEMSTPEKDAVDAILLGTLKDRVINKISVQEEKYFRHVATFSWNGFAFSLSLDSQVKWLYLFQARNSLTYPYRVAARNDVDFYDVPDASTIVSMSQAAMAAMNNVFTKVTTAKEQIRQATTVDEIQTIYDNLVASVG